MLKKRCYMLFICLLIMSCSTAGSTSKRNFETLEGKAVSQTFILHKSINWWGKYDVVEITKTTINNDSSYTLYYTVVDRVQRNATSFNVRVDNEIYRLTDANPTRNNISSTTAANYGGYTAVTNTNAVLEILSFALSPEMLNKLQKASSIEFESKIRPKLTAVNANVLQKMRKFLR